MRLYEKEVIIPLMEGNKELLQYFYESPLTDEKEVPIRFVVTKTDEVGYHCEVGVLSDFGEYRFSSTKSIFDFRKRSYENLDKFNVVLVIPTGIGADLGGHAGDAGALARLFCRNCDTLITHPNVVNASDINELPENGLYVEGSVLSRLMMGVIGLQRVKSNRLEVIIENHKDQLFVDFAINSVNASRVTLGILFNEVLKLNDPFYMGSKYSRSGRAVGSIDNLENLLEVLNSKKGSYDAIAISSVIDMDSRLRNEYYVADLVNPWGGAEAMLTHAVSLIFNLPCAHSPMEHSIEYAIPNFGMVDPRKAAETVSSSYLHCILKGLSKSPKIINDLDLFCNNGILSAEDIGCLVIPDGCVGLPTLAALEQGIPVIAVKENENLMKNDLTKLPWQEGQLMIVENYWEAVGVLSALRFGIDPWIVRRPLNDTTIIQEKV